MKIACKKNGGGNIPTAVYTYGSATRITTFNITDETAENIIIFVAGINKNHQALSFTNAEVIEEFNHMEFSSNYVSRSQASYYIRRTAPGTITVSGLREVEFVSAIKI